MAWSGIQYDTTPYTLEIDEQDQLYYIERLIVEANTGSNVVTPVLIREDSNITLSTISTATRLMTEIAVNRLGPMLGLQLNATYGSQNIQIHEIALFLRKVELVMNMAPTRSRTMVPGRSVTPTSTILFDIHPFLLPENTHHINPIIRRIYVDAQIAVGQTVTPVLTYDSGTTSVLAALATGTRDITEYSIMTSNRVRRIHLAGDFTNSGNIIFSIESDWYYPSSRAYRS